MITWTSAQTPRVTYRIIVQTNITSDLYIVEVLLFTPLDLLKIREVFLGIKVAAQSIYRMTDICLF